MVWVKNATGLYRRQWGEEVTIDARAREGERHNTRSTTSARPASQPANNNNTYNIERRVLTWLDCWLRMAKLFKRFEQESTQHRRREKSNKKNLFFLDFYVAFVSAAAEFCSFIFLLASLFARERSTQLTSRRSYVFSSRRSLSSFFLWLGLGSTLRPRPCILLNLKFRIRVPERLATRPGTEKVREEKLKLKLKFSPS